MPFVMEMLAYFHHSELIPDSVYQYGKENQNHPLHQPPTLHLLSSRILTALSDAAWGAHEAAVKEASKDQAQYNFLGHEIPGSRYKVRTPELGPEVWLELVLWSTLHGGWSLDGAAILDKMMTFEDEKRRWSAMYWRSQDTSSTGDLNKNDLLSLLGLRGVQANSPDRLSVEKTISVEVVAAFVHALLNSLRVGVGKRGQTPEDLLERIRKLKSFLSRSQAGLGGMSWDAVVIRFLESPGVRVETKPHLVQSLMTLVSPFGKELEYINAPKGGAGSSDVPLYVLDASAAPLGVLHRVISAHIKRGDTNGGFAALAQLQEFTDLNKSISLKLFFDSLMAETKGERKSRNTFDSNIPQIEFPSYYPQLTTHLMASILDLAAESEAYDFGQWLLFSEDIDGPLIPPSKYRDPVLAPSLIKFGTATRDAQLVQDVITAQTPEVGTLADLPNAVLQAFLGCQIENRRWDSVANILTFMTKRTEQSWSVGTLSRLAKELLLLERPTPDLSDAAREESLAKGKSIYRAMVRGVYGIENRQRIEDVHISMCFLASISPEWSDFCNSLWLRTGTRYIASESYTRYRYRFVFAAILQGVAQSRGSIDAKRFFCKWCLDPADAPAASNAPGGVPMMSRFRPTRAKQLERSPEHTIVVAQFDGEDICLRGQLLEPQIPYLRSIYTSALHERAQEYILLQQKADLLEVLEWAAAGLRHLGVEDEDIDRELGGMLSRGELRLEPKRKNYGFLNDEDDGID
ncbi:hypothetical protein K490DRAFT_57515 [Saccharata proteae CBS 121410]|uniref:Uncharacterized protein n=1 Tax=Saccharata proteae CBS 121410 TaxID=1314787 RepID=A0A9P4LXZ5_9PEZI|nr:hypothetical protein K490DRAFT_57515 [Saccharata proteae CBS 121410]